MDLPKKSYEDIWADYNAVADSLRGLETNLDEFYAHSKLKELRIAIKDIHANIEIRDKVKRWIITQIIRDLLVKYHLKFIPFNAYSIFYEMNVDFDAIEKEFVLNFVENAKLKVATQSTLI